MSNEPADAGDTPKIAVTEYGPGFLDGYRIGMQRTLDCFRQALIEDGTDPGEAYLLAEKLRRWIVAHGG